MRPNWKRVLQIVAVVLITALLASALTITIMNKSRGDRVVLTTAQYEVYRQIDPLLELFEMAENTHYSEHEISREQLMYGAMQGALSALDDPYARYYSEEEYVAYLEQLNGAYHGIGALIGQPVDGGVPVLKVYAGSPGEQAGLVAGDIILSVDGNTFSGLTLEEIEQLFVGEDGTVAAVRILRAEEEQTLSITRGKGTIAQVDYRLFNQYTGYIRIDKFSGTAHEEVKEGLQDLIDRGMRSLVIDIRNNPGGELEQVVAIADLLLPRANIVTVSNADGTEKVYTSDAKGVSVPIAVLVNGNSASASEVLAAAIQENDHGIVVGTSTYGKGVVQTTARLESNGGWVKMTTAVYYTPLGNNVNNKGVQPDIVIDLADELKGLPIDQIDQEDDAQLWAALDEIRAQADALNDAAGGAS
ncbi:S41 family peptidase [Christensenellaceae bacterium OttesenSCG-928-L17]|nr:S41 family peptidase [Christensenellaceae bacterium OttesenSCG-928-L17]